MSNAFSSIEDKWYTALDALDQKGVPVYSVIDPIDKIIPSFWLGVILLLAILGAGGYWYYTTALNPEYGLELRILDENDVPLSGIKVDYSVLGEQKTLPTDASGIFAKRFPAGTRVRIQIIGQKTGSIEREEFERAYLLTRDIRETINLLSPVHEPTIRTVLLQGPDAALYTGSDVRVRFACTNPSVFPIPRDGIFTQTKPELQVEEPNDCEGLSLVVISPSEFEPSTFRLTKPITIISPKTTARLAQPPKGSLAVRIINEQKIPITETSLEIELRSPDGERVATKYSGTRGNVVFEEKPGNYRVSVIDPDGRYASATSDPIEINADHLETITITLSRQIAARLTLRVIDDATGERISHATITLRDPGEENTAVSQTTNGTGDDLVFASIEKHAVRVYAQHEDYFLPAPLELAQNDGNATVRLMPWGPENRGRVQVRVLDEKGKPVANAKVKLRYLDTGFVATPPEPGITDKDGNLLFYNVPPGSYYAYAEKYPAFGDNKDEGREINLREITKFTINLFIGDSTLDIRALNEDNEPIVEATARIYDETGTLVGTLPLPQGTATFQTKADKRVYVVLSHPDYFEAQTVPKQLFPKKTIAFHATLKPPLLFGKPQIQFIKITDPAGADASILEPGQKYLAHYRFSIPKNQTYARAGIHFRAGDSTAMENDPVYVYDVLGGNPAPTSIRATTYSPPTGYAFDIEHASINDAKWANLEFDEPAARDYYVAFAFKVKNTVTRQTRLPFHYRAYAITPAGPVVRIPEDDELGDEQNTPEKNGLYAKTFDDLVFAAGEAFACNDPFCFNLETLYGKTEQLFLNRPFEPLVNAEYDYAFGITNNSPNAYQKSELFIDALPDSTGAYPIDIQTYRIENASAKKTEGTPADPHSIGPIDLGNYFKGTSALAKLGLWMRAEKRGELRLRIVADAHEVYQKTISFDISSRKKLALSIEPDFLPPDAITQSTLSVLEHNEGGIDVPSKDARARVTRQTPDGVTFELGQKFTDEKGQAGFELNASPPRTTFTFEAEKPGQTADPLVLTVDANIVTFDPNALAIALATKKRESGTAGAILSNKLGTDLFITEVSFAGKTKGLLNTQAMRAFLGTLRNTRIPAHDSWPEVPESNPIFKAQLAPDAAKRLKQSTRLDLELLIKLRSNETQNEYAFKLPATVTVQLGDAPENEKCLVVTQKQWKGVTQGNRATIEFEIQNNCTIDGKFVGLDKLVSKVDWTGDIMGNVELSIFESGSGQANTQTLNANLWTTVLTDVPPNAVYHALLTFTPNQGFLGKDAKFNVVIDAQTETNEGPVLVNNEETYIESTIKIINLEQCLKIEAKGANDSGIANGGGTSTEGAPSESVVEVPFEGAGQFTIDSSDCGPTNIDVSLCRNDPKCAGGAEGGIEVSPEKFTLRPDKSTQQINVRYQEIPGLYGIKVDARTPGGSYRKIAFVDARVEADPDAQIELSKYYFILKGRGAKDSATVTNNHVVDEVNVDASVCDWGYVREEDEKDPSSNAGLGAALGALMGLGPALDAMQTAGSDITDDSSQKTKDAKDQAKKANEAADKANKSATKTNDDVTNLNDKVNTLDKKVTDLGEDTKKAQDALKPLATKCPARFSSLSSTYAEAMKIYSKNAKTGATQAISEMGKATEGMQSVVDSATQGLDAMKQGTQGFSQTLTDNPGNAGSAQASGNLANTAAGLGELASGQFTDSVDSFTGAVDSLGGVTDNVGKSFEQVQNVSENIDNLGTYAKDASEIITNSPLTPEEELMYPDCKAALETAKTTTKTVADGAKNASEEAVKNVQDMKEPVNESLETATNDAQDAADQSQEAVDKTETADNANKKSSDSQKKVSDNAKKFSGEGIARGLGIMGTYAGLGALAGMLLDGLFEEDDEDKCDQRAQNTLIDYFTNLLGGDAGPLKLDKEGITPNWDRTKAKVFGNWERQEMGIVFENSSGIAIDEPLYSTLDLTIHQHPHPGTVIVQRGEGGLAGIGGMASIGGGAGAEGGAPAGGSGDIVGGSFGGLGNFSPVLRKNSPAQSSTFKFHLKFKTKEYAEKAPEIPPESMCVQGTLIGQTGPEGLPKIAFNWNWSETEGITKFACDATNEKGIYCDATQFTIAMTKRLHALDEFLYQNRSTLHCPPNPALAQLRDMAEPYHDVLGDINLPSLAMPEREECWVPASTTLFDGKPALEYYVESPTSSVQWTTEIPDMETLHKTITWKARLVQDGYSPDFLSDFRNYYVENAFFNAPDYFVIGGPNGRLGDYFQQPERLFFSNRYDASTAIPSGGTYDILLEIDFDDQLTLFSGGVPSAKINAQYYLEQEARPNNAFYSMPLDGPIGRQTSNGRQGYASNYSNANDAILLGTFQGERYDTASIAGSNALVKIKTEWNTDPKRLNALASSRGALLYIDTTGGENNEKRLVFSPNYATPVMLRVKSGPSDEPVKGFFDILRNKAPETWGQNAQFWTGAGACMDFTGSPASQTYAFVPDRKAESTDKANNWQFAYKVEWPSAEKGGDTFLKTYFFTPADAQYDLRASSSNLSISSANQAYTQAAALNGIRGMTLNDQQSQSGVQSIDEIFELVRNRHACVTTNNTTTLFWWNTGELHKLGPNSLAKQEQALRPGSTCIGP